MSNNSTDTVGLVDSIISQLTAAPEALAAAGVGLAAAAYAYLRVPLVRYLVYKYVPVLLNEYDDEINALADAYLTKLQNKAYKKLDGAVQQRVKDRVLREVILSSYDHYDDVMADTVRRSIRDALTTVRRESLG